MRVTSVAEANPIKIALFVALLLLPLALLNTRAAADDLRHDESLKAAHEAYEASDYPKAARLLQLAVEQNPRDAEIHLLLAKTYYEFQQHDAAIASAEQAVALDPQSSVYHEWLGKVYGEKADHAGMFSALSLAKKARKEFERAVQLDAKNFSAYQALIEFDCSAPAIAGGGEDKAGPEIARLAALDAAEGHYAAGNCRRQKKDFAAADAQFDKALELHPKSAELIYDIGDYAMKHNQAERLAVVADEGEKVVPSDPRSEFYRGVAWVIKNERYQDSERLLREYLKRAPLRNSFPPPWRVHEWLGRLYENQQKTQAALEEYEAALKLEPKSKNAREALKRLKKAEGLRPRVTS
ncbi:MAG TPA: tetratricopeptide repeat protein [Candidatus Acidoferrum sp.]|nr:tetratricopeptide repeat protein [Candidatus Acidoferrum sp.]